MTYSGKMISGGKAVIPAELRRQLGFKAGDRIIFERQGRSKAMIRFCARYRQI